MHKILILIGCLWFCTGHAQEVMDSSVNKIQDKDAYANLKHPGVVHAAMFSAYAASTYVCYRFLDSRIQHTSQKAKDGFLTFISGSVSDLGLGRSQAILLVTTSAAAFISKNKKLEQVVLTWAGALLINSVVTDEIKKTFQRHRPNTGDAYNVFDWRGGSGINRSFASAHTSNAFTTATIFATLYKNHHWVPVVAYSVAALVGASRIYDNEHWASDVMAGAAFGYLSAKAMNEIYKKAAKKISLLPVVGRKGGSIHAVYHF